LTLFNLCFLMHRMLAVKPAIFLEFQLALGVSLVFLCCVVPPFALSAL